MANKFSSLIFTEEGKDVMTKALADKGQMSIINAYTFTVSLTKDLTYSQISSLNPKQTKPMGTVTTDLTTNTVESRLIIDNRDVTADYNLKGIAITGVYGTDNYVLGIINTNETTLVPAYNGQSAQTINLDVSFAISDTSIVTVNTQYAGMLTVADYIALQKYIDQRDAKKADDTAAVHKTGNETINDIKTFLKTIVGSVSGNSGTSDRVNTLAINADVALSSLNNGVYLSTNASKTTSDKPTGAAETYVFVKESNVERFTDISNGQSYFRVKNGSTYTAWNRFSTAAELSNVDASAVHKTGNETIGGSKTFSSAIIANLQGNADTATKLKTARTISFSGAATGTGTFDGSGNVDIALTESAITRTNTSSSQSLAVGGTVTIIDSITTNTSGEITGVNVKTATMPSVYPPNNDSNLVHKSGAETIGGSKTFTDGLSGALAGNATSATKLANARKINGENFDGSADINVDPVVQVISTNKDVFTLDNGFYYYSNVSATNKPSGSSNYFVVEVIQSTNNGFMQLVDSNNNAWWTTKSGGAWSAWKAVANDELVAHLDTAETFTGKKTFSAGLAGELTGNAATATTLKTARKIGGVPFDGTQDIDLAGVNTGGNQNTSGNAATATKWATTRTLALTGDVSGSVNIDGSGDVSMATSGTNLVHKTGAETIAGDKTFTGTNTFNKKIIAPAGVQGPIDLSQISVGGRNLLLDTGRSFTGIGNNSTGGMFDAQGGKYYLAGGKTVSDLYNQYGQNGYLTLSFDWVASGSTLSGRFNPQWAGQPYGGLAASGAIFISSTDTSGHYKTLVPLAQNGYSTGIATSIQFRQDNLQGNVTISNLKLEAGNIETDWTPAPEDVPISLVIGSRNLLLGTTNWSGDSTRWTKRGTVTDSSVTYRGMIVASTSSAWISPVYMMQNAGILQVGKTYTFSTYVRNTSDTDTTLASFYDNGIVRFNGNSVALPAHTDWKRVSTTFTVIKDPATSTSGLRWESGSNLTNGQVQFAGYKLEEGNVPTDWTPAPEDVDNAYVKDTRLASGITDFNLVMGKTWSGKWYKVGGHWSNEPAGASNYLQFEYSPGDAERSGILEIRDWVTNRYWMRAVSGGTWSNWVELANDSNVVHNTGNETVAGDKTFTGNLNVSGTISSTDTYLRVGKPILSPIISSSVVMWYGWKVYYYVHNGVVTYQIQTNSSTIPAGTKSNEKLPAAARPIYKTFVPLAYGGQGFAINIDGTFENYTGVEISGASWASATSHVLNL
ncbi:pyocin knob domain-containing protein [Weissella confusa]|uniref:pyocin knob domain-containing protein n=2 Tax=Weissella confusa TaxID=1583 RepID=UPI00223BEF3F|nr:pyocin knob domain-containing protein [Weissella confusa]MCT0022372.1 hypothetical protein [Weissella confusa]